MQMRYEEGGEREGNRVVDDVTIAGLIRFS